MFYTSKETKIAKFTTVGLILATLVLCIINVLVPETATKKTLSNATIISCSFSVLAFYEMLCFHKKDFNLLRARYGRETEKDQIKATIACMVLYYGKESKTAEPIKHPYDNYMQKTPPEKFLELKTPVTYKQKTPISYLPIGMEKEEMTVKILAISAHWQHLAGIGHSLGYKVQINNDDPYWAEIGAPFDFKTDLDVYKNILKELDIPKEK